MVKVQLGDPDKTVCFISTWGGYTEHLKYAMIFVDRDAALHYVGNDRDTIVEYELTEVK